MEGNYSEIKKHLKKKLDENRYEHTIAVAYTSAAMAMRYGYSIEQAYVAGLLHDCGKYGSSKRIYEKCIKFDIPISKEEEKNPSLLHAKLGAYYAKKRYGIDNQEILSAIACHTTGKPDMTLLEKIIFVADYIEPLRNRAKNLEELRRMAFDNLDLCVCKILHDTLEYLKEKKIEVDYITQETYNYYVGILNQQDK